MAEYSTDKDIVNAVLKEIQYDTTGHLKYRYYSFLPVEWAWAMWNKVSCSRAKWATRNQGYCYKVTTKPHLITAGKITSSVLQCKFLQFGLTEAWWVKELYWKLCPLHEMIVLLAGTNIWLLNVFSRIHYLVNIWSKSSDWRISNLFRFTIQKGQRFCPYPTFTKYYPKSSISFPVLVVPFTFWSTCSRALTFTEWNKLLCLEEEEMQNCSSATDIMF